MQFAQVQLVIIILFQPLKSGHLINQDILPRSQIIIMWFHCLTCSVEGRYCSVVTGYMCMPLVFRGVVRSHVSCLVCEVESPLSGY